MKSWLVTSSLVVAFAGFSFGQGGSASGVDLDLKVQNGSDVFRGGEPILYTITLSNVGSAKATDVILINDPLKSGELVSAVPSRGTCELINDEYSQKRVRCRIGDMEAGSSLTVTVSGKLHDFGDSSEKVDEKGLPVISPSDDPATKARKEAMRNIAGQLSHLVDERGGTNVDGKESLLSIYVAADSGQEQNEENNAIFLKAKLLPSRNAPPKVRVISPKNDALITRRARSPLRLNIEIEASDPDGTIKEVVVRESFFGARIVAENGGYTWLYNGRKFSGKELDDHWRSFPPPRPKARRTAPNRYVFVATALDYGPNRLLVEVVDNGGRYTSVPLTLIVKGDATIKIVSPKPDQIVPPGSDLVVETESVLNEGQVKEIVFQAMSQYENLTKGPQKVELVSRKGSTYRHRFVLKKLPENPVYTNLSATLIEDSGALTQADGVGFLVRTPPNLEISSISEGQVFRKGETVNIKLEAPLLNISDQYRLYIDGKYEGDISSGFNWTANEVGPHLIEIVAFFSKVDPVELARSKPIRIEVR